MQINPPTPQQIKAARRSAGVTQSTAAQMTHLGSHTRWAEYEAGTRNIDLARWELFIIKIDQHPEFQRSGPQEQVAS